MAKIFEAELDDEWRVNWSMYVEDLVVELLRRKAPLADVNFRTLDADTPLHTAAVIAVMTESTKLVSVPPTSGIQPAYKLFQVELV